MQLLDDEETRARIRECLDSGSWWMILDLDASGVSNAIEETYYSGEKNGDFHLIMGAAPFMGLFFAHKKHMTASQLAVLLVAEGAPFTETELEAMLERQDVLVPFEGLNPGVIQDTLTSLNTWLYGGEGA